MNLSKYLCSVTALWEAGCRLHPLYRGCNLATPPAPKRYETNNKTEKDYDTAQEKDGICAVQIIQA